MGEDADGATVSTVVEESSTVAGDDAPADPDYRIAPELKADLARATGNERAEFAFVDRMEAVDDDVAEVTFRLPFDGETFTQRFRRPGAPAAYALPSLAELYDAAGAEADDPDSILETSVPLESTDGYEVDHVDAAVDERVSVDWLPADVTLLPDRERGLIERWASKALGVAAVGAGAVAWADAGLFAGLAVGGLVALVALVAASQFDAYPPPEGAGSIDNLSAVDVGDVLVLDRSPVYSTDDRELLRIVDDTADGYEAARPGGEIVEVVRTVEDWHVREGDDEHEYDEAHRLPVDP